MDKPHFEHDCHRPGECCRWAGSTEPGSNYGVFDVYASRGYGDHEPHILVRYSSDGPDYRFGPVEQYRRSVERNPDPEWSRFLEIYDAFIAEQEAGNGHA